MAQLDFIIQGFTAFIDGFGKAGAGEELTLPKLKKKTEDFRGGGMLASRKVAMGYEAFEFDLSLSSFDPQVISKGGLFTNKELPLSVRGYMDGDDNAQHTAICQMVGEFTDIDPGKWQAGKKAMLQAKASLISLKLTIDGAVIWDIDIKNGVYSVGGVDPYAGIRAALGF